MIRRPNEDDINERKEIWGYIHWWMDKLGLTPEELAHRVRYSPDLIQRGISGEPVPIRHALRSFVEAFSLRSASRAKFYEETDDVLSDDECKELLKPPTPMRPRQRNFWD